MQKIYGIITACALVLVSCQVAAAGDGHGLPWIDFLLRIVNAAIFIGIIIVGILMLAVLEGE